ncbi:MAG: autotransporter-associated beta strand repeat-containing protein [Verrucomicrobiota bacterium]
MKLFSKFLAAVFLLGCAVLTQAAGTGLTGEYFTTNNFTGAKSTRVDATVDFDWGTNSPGFGGLGTNNFSIRWYGQLEPRYSETYTFYVTADEGATLWVNDRLIVSRLYYSTPAQMGGQIALRANERVNIRLEYFERTNTASVRLEWTSASQAREVVPQSQLYPNTMPAERGSILREHWANLPGTAVTNLTGFTNYPNKPDGREMFLSFECLQPNWTTNVGTRLSGYVMPQTNGVYTFAVAASDTAELWMSPDTNPANNQLIALVTNATAFRDWSNQVSQVSTGRTLVAWQKYYIELRHKAGVNSNHYSVAWQPPGGTRFSVIDADYLIPAGLNNVLPAQTNIFNILTQSHPRLYATAERFAWLRQQVAINPAGQPAQWYASIYASATNLFNLTANPPVTYSLSDTKQILTQSRTVKARMHQLGLAWKISGDTNFAERAWAELNSAGNFTDWNSANSFLDTAEMTAAFGVGYDWFYEYWSPARSTFIITNIIVKGLQPGLSAYQANVGWARPTGNNWNLVCNGGLTIGALAVGTNSSIAPLILTNAVSSCAPVMQRFTTDNGPWYEGPGYWDYACDYNFRMLASLQSALGTDFGLSTTNGLNNAGLFGVLCTSANGRNFNFADTGGAGASQGPFMMWWARRFDVPAYASYQRTNNTADALSDLWWDGRGGDPVSEDIGSDILFLGPTSSTPFNPQHVGVFRSSWGDKNETFLAFKGGQMGADHGNLDAGDFVLEALGKRWAWDLGSDNYALPGYFDSNANSATNRWDYYRMRAEGQNTIVINPGNGPDTALGPVAPVLTFQSKSSARAVSVMDLTPVETNVLRAWRGFQLFGALRKQVLIQDEVVGATNATLWWFMHYQTAGMQVTLSPDGTSVTMTQGTNRLWGKILSSGGTFQIMDARPLPTSPDPAGQDLNPTFQKLAIHLTGFTNTTIAVWFVPLTLGQIPPVVPPALTPLAQWQIPQDDPPVASDGYFSIQKNTTLNVNLTTLVTDASTPVSNLVYTVTGATNGTVTLLADGVTAQFTPTPDFYSTGQFLYTATDAAGNSASAAAVITILPENWYWDTSTAAGLQPASGTWDSSTATWSAGAAGSNPLRVWPALGNDAIFTGAAGTYTVSIAGTQTVNQITTTNGTWIFTNGTLNHFNGPMTITAHANTTLNSPLNADTDLNKLGTNRLTLNAAVSFSGDVFVPAGTLRISTNNALPATASLTLGANTTAGALDLTSASQIFSGLTVITTNSALTNLITVGGSQTLAFTGGVTVGFDAPTNSFTMTTMSGGGTLVVTNAAQNVTIGVSAATTGAQGNSATLNLARLGSVTLGTTLSPLGELRIGYGNGGGSSSATLTLSDTNNSITATTVQVGNSVQNNGTSGTLMMGAGTNILTADTINIGQGKVPGTVKFASQTAGSPGSLVIGGLSGPAADIWIGYKNGAGTSANPTSTLDLRGHNATVTANTLAIAVENGANSGGEIGLLYFDGGVFTATNVIIAAKSGTSTSPAAGTLNLSGGTFTVFDGGSFTLASQTGTGAANGTLNLTGGTLNSQVDILDGAGINTSTVTLNGGTLNMFGHNLGSATNINTLTFLSGTLANVGEINAGSPLVKTGAGLLTLSGTNSYLGATTITTGELVGATGGSCSNSAVIVLAGATNGVQVLSTGGQWVCRSLTGHTNTYLDFNFGSVPPSITTAPLQVLVTFTYTNPTIIVHTTAGITNGQYPLIQYGARSGTRITNVTFIPALSTKSSYSLITNFVRSTIDLAIVSTNNNGALSWAAGNGFWDINTTANWQNGGVGGFYYQDGKHVILDDTAGGVSPILVANAVTVSPASVTVNATNKSYIISGSAMAGSGSLTKNGAGTLTLSGTNSYTGATTINAGMLLVDGNALACTNTVLVASNAVFGGKGAVGGAVTVAAGGKLAPGGLYNAGTLILTNRLALNGGRLFFDFANLSNGGTNDLMMVGGAVYLTNANSIFLSGGAPAGDYPLMTYAAASGPGTFALTANYPNVSLVVNPTNLVLHVGTGGSTFGLTWKGYVSGKWDTYALNWTNGAVTTNFNAGDNVIFDDTLAGNATITNAAPGVMVAPGLVTFNNNLTNYTVNANIGGLASLAKLGAATVTLAGTNAYTGDTIISAGELLNSSGGSCSNSTVTVLASATNGVQILTAGGQWFCSGLNTGNGSYLDFDFGSTPPSAATAPLQVLNTFTYSNPTIILRTTATAITNGQYPLIKYGARSGTAISNVTFIPAPAGNLSYSLVINAVRSTIDLVAASTNNNGALSWAAGNGYWDINTSANWQNDGVTGFYYQDGKNVILDDSASGASPVLVTNAMTVSPASVTVNATNKSYIISGSAIAGSGSLTKNGAGSLTLSGTNSYTGATTINAGELVGVTGGSCANSAVTVLAGATNGVQVLTPGGQWLCSSLTSHTNTCLDFNFGSVIPGAATAPLQVLNTFTFTNPTIILRAATGITNGQYPLIKYGALSGTTFSVTFVPALAVSLSYSLITNTVRSTIDLLIIKASTAGALSWAAGNGYWDINTSANWQNDGVTGFYYQDGKNVILDDSASGASPVLVTNAMTVSPASVTVNATNKSYTISGSSIAGSGSLTKNGAGSLTIYCANTYAGDTTVSAGTLVIGSGGAINSPNATLNVGPDVNKAASTLAGGGAIAVKTLLATNVACGGATNSIFNFSGGMLATSNSNGLAASILLTSNASLTMNSSWNLNGGTNILSNVATNQNAAAVVYVGNGVNDVQVQVNPGATWWHAIPANSSASNILSLYVGNGNATNNAFIVNGGTLVVTNATGTAIPVAIGNSTGSVNNQLAVLNGGQVFTRCFGGGSPQSGTIGNNGNDNSAIVAGTNAAGRKAMWNFGGDRLYLGNTSSSNSWIRVDQGGVITNCQLFLWNNAPSLFITNGGQLFANAASVGRTGFNSTLIVAGADGAGNKATLAFISGSMTIGGGSVSASNPGTNNLVRVDSGGIITNVSLVSIGGSHTTYDINCISNALIITNGGQVFGTGNSTIGLNTNCNGNSASVGGGAGGSVWRFNNTALTIGNNANATNNFVTLFSGGVLTNVSSVILGGVYSRFNFNGGTLAAGASGNLLNTNNTAINAAVYVQAGGAVIDSAGFNVTNRMPLLQDTNSPGGSLTKLGSGTLTLLGTNNYTGNTTVSTGTLSVQQPAIDTNSTVTVAGGAVLNLGFSVTNPVAKLVINGVRKAQGVYNNTTDPGYLTGSGSLLVQSYAANYPTNITVNLSGSQLNMSLNMSWPATHLGWYLQSNSVNLASPNLWHDVPNSQNVINLVIPISPALTNVFYRLSNTSKP